MTDTAPTDEQAEPPRYPDRAPTPTVQAPRFRGGLLERLAAGPGGTRGDATPGSAGPPPDPRTEPRRSRTSLWILLGLLAFLGLTGGLAMIVVILAIVVVIFLHELGHYLTAKWAGMKVTEFFLGFGPKLWSFRRGETEYGVKASPAGAYVRILGMHNLEDVEPEDEPRTYRQQPYWRRMSVAVAGSTMHFVIAGVCLWALLVFHGVPGERLFDTDPPRANELTNWEVDVVSTDSAAQRAGLQEGDQILAIDGVETRTFGDLRSQIEAKPEATVILTVDRAGEAIPVTATLGRQPDDPSKGFLGIGPRQPFEQQGPIEALANVPGEFTTLGVQSVKGIVKAFSPAGLADLADKVADGGDQPGPAVVGDGEGGGAPANVDEDESDSGGGGSGDDRVVSLLGAIDIGTQATEAGWAGLFLFMIVLNVFIGIFNLVPLLPLDGGHVAIATYEKIRSLFRRGEPYHADVTKLLPLTYAVVAILVMVGLSTMYLDIVNPVS